ncbi:MAG TPA: ACT domain-containing protein [Mobilitalea sp.]|nr:ACT domain-containing protein [Mobilitalea sp.]
MSDKKLTLSLLKDNYAVCRLEPGSLIPDYAYNSDFYSITGTRDELSVVCLSDAIPEDVTCEKDWSIIKVEGPLDFSLIGILAPICTILADKKISIFAISTYDTDYILVRKKDVAGAVKALTEEGYEILK